MDTHAGFSERNITLSFEFTKSIIDDPAKENLRLGLEAAERGENVHIRHVKNLSSAMPQSP
jgi:hypothetical protein